MKLLKLTQWGKVSQDGMAGVPQVSFPMPETGVASSSENTEDTHSHGVPTLYRPTPNADQVVPRRFRGTGTHIIDRSLHITSSSLHSLPRSLRHRSEMSGLETTIGIFAPGALFRGFQKSANEEKTYEVEVSIKDVNRSEYFMCGYLTIHNLTTDYPSLTTFFEAEVIGPRHGFQTMKWGANLDADHKHWERFPYFKDHCLSYLYSPNSSHYDFNKHPVVFMRWKEHFLVPDHRIDHIDGASYAGFYYIAYDRGSRTVEGFYYHQHTNEFQRLYLEHVPSKTTASFEFR